MKKLSTKMSGDTKILVSVSSFIGAFRNNKRLIYKAYLLFALMLMILVLKYSLTTSVYEVRLRLHIGSIFTINTQPFWGFDSPKWRLIENTRFIVSEYKEIYGSGLQSLKTKIESSSLTLLIRRRVTIGMLADIKFISNRIINKHNIYQEKYYANSPSELVRAAFHRHSKADRTTVKYISTEPLFVGPSAVKYFVYGLLAIIALALLYLCSQIMNEFLRSHNIQIRMSQL